MFKRLKREENSDVLERVVPVFGHSQRSSAVQKPFDVYLFVTTLLLVLIGILMIFSSSAILAKEHFGDTYYFLKRELTFLVIGLGCLFVVKNIPYRLYAKFIYPLLGGVFFLMLLSFIPGLSHSAKGASRWLNVFGFTLQPSEFAKVIVVIFAAYLTSKKGIKIREFKKGFVPVIGVAGLFILMILAQKDLGTASVLAAVVFILLAVAGTRMTYLGGSILAAIPALYVLIFSVAFRRARIMAFLDPWKYQMDTGFQIIQSFVAFNSGGFAGVGLGESKQKLFYLPEAHTDFIFSVLAEEFGMIGVILVMTLFLIFIYHGLKISKRARDPFGALLALGITCLIGLQAFINFAVVMGILPTKGLALPFISYGGSSLIASLFAVGILLNISTEIEAETK